MNKPLFLVLTFFVFSSCNKEVERSYMIGHWMITSNNEYYEIYSKGGAGYYLFDGVTGDYFEELDRPMYYGKSPNMKSRRTQDYDQIERKLFSEVLGIKDSIYLVEISFETNLSLDSFRTGSKHRFMEWLGSNHRNVEVWEDEIEYDLESY